VATLDREHWDERYAGYGSAVADEVGPPPVFASHEALFPSSGRVLELACGRGRAAVWLARRGLHVWGLDVSPVAIDLARELADHHGLGHRCRFDVVDLDEGLPSGVAVEVVFCHMFRDPRLDDMVMQRLTPGGLLAIAELSESGVGPGPHRAPEGDLRRRFESLQATAWGERDGEAWLLARRPR
jgi:SAM-dependent methyltransferase